jgi:two-component system chemotaxis sensor kinase CheA
MDREQIQSFIQTAEADLARARGSLLLFGQSGDLSDIEVARRTIACVKEAAVQNSQASISALAAECEAKLEQLTSANEVYKALDVVARIEASLLDIPLNSDGFLSDVSDFVDSSFDDLLPQQESQEDIFTNFEIDDETFEIFKSEAEELLSNINNSLRTLTFSATDQNALWEIRRSSHTLKGAAGIVGLAEASETAHRMEDLLDKLVELKREAAPPIVQFLETSAKKLTSVVESKPFDHANELESQYLAAMDALGSDSGTLAETNAQPEKELTESERPLHKPIVRVSLERLDELLQLSHELISNRDKIAEKFTELFDGNSPNNDFITKIESLFETAYRLNGKLNDRLLQIRMVKFSTLETRLSRTVNLTCMDEGKKAIFELENGDVEIDTLIIDSIVEPLLHLLKNAVVHGIETPETRRLIGKNERGSISVKVEVENDLAKISVTDDGNGVSVQKLKAKAIENGVIDEAKAATMSDREAFELMFDRGLTTAAKIDLNAGRGVGMSIVKESVESRGGLINIESEPQRGTKFTLLMPVASPQSISDAPSFFAQTNEEEMQTILVVDDSASIRHQTQKLVEAAGFKCITANNGADALELLLNGDFEPDLILSDVEMPQIDGWQFLEYIKTDDNLGHIPIVLVTSLDADEDRTRAFDLGAADYIVKPLNSDSFEKVTENLLSAVIA